MYTVSGKERRELGAFFSPCVTRLSTMLSGINHYFLSTDYYSQLVPVTKSMSVNIFSPKTSEQEEAKSTLEWVYGIRSARARYRDEISSTANEIFSTQITDLTSVDKKI